MQTDLFLDPSPAPRLWLKPTYYRRDCQSLWWGPQSDPDKAEGCVSVTVWCGDYRVEQQERLDDSPHIEQRTAIIPFRHVVECMRNAAIEMPSLDEFSGPSDFYGLPSDQWAHRYAAALGLAEIANSGGDVSIVDCLDCEGAEAA